MKYTNVIERVPPGVRGKAEICHDIPSPIERLRASLQGMPLDREKYVRLLIDGNTMMTDAEFERRSNAFFMHEAHGNCLIAGLGIGLVLDPVVDRCASVTVIENNADVIALVAPHFPKVTVIYADIWEWRPAKGAKFDTIYFDIWPHFNEDTNGEAKQLHAAFRKYRAKGSYMESWTYLAMRSKGWR